MKYNQNLKKSKITGASMVGLLMKFQRKKISNMLRNFILNKNKSWTVDTIAKYYFISKMPRINLTNFVD
jgi:hypothetical protein